MGTPSALALVQAEGGSVPEERILALLQQQCPWGTKSPWARAWAKGRVRADLRLGRLWRAQYCRDNDRFTTLVVPPL